MSRPSCTAIIIYPPHTRYLSMLLHGAKEYSNSSSRINKHIFAEFSSAVSRKERDRGNWLRLWKLVNHDGAPPRKNRQKSGETGFSETAVPQRRRERRWPSSLLENSVCGVPLPLSGEGKRPEGGRERGWLTRRGQPL